jgi:putative transcriptional regulator
MVGVRRETIVNLENGRYNPSLRLASAVRKVMYTTYTDKLILPTFS